MASPKSRSAVRTGLASLLTTELTVTNTYAAAVYDHLPLSFDYQSPVVTVFSGGSNPDQFGVGTQQYRTRVRVEVGIWVADQEKDDATWTRADVEDRLDVIFQSVMKVIAENRANGSSWEYIEFPGEFSEITRVVYSGKPYWLETIMLEARVHDGT